MTYTITQADLKAAKPCPGRHKEILRLIKIWPASAEDAFAAGASVDDVLWIAGRMAENDAELKRRLRHAAADIAERVLPIFQDRFPSDMRVRDCIRAIRLYAEKRISTEELDAARAAAGAAWEAARDAARDAARNSERKAQQEIICRWLGATPPAVNLEAAA